MYNIGTGIYIRTTIDGGSTSYLLEDLTPDSRSKWLERLDKEGLIRCIEILCETIKECNNQ